MCGDAVHMAGDVHEALLGVMKERGSLSTEQYMEKLEKATRYQRDVWAIGHITWHNMNVILDN